MSPQRLALELGRSPKVLRAWLRRTYPRPTGERNNRWELSRDQAEAARQHFSAGQRGARTRPAPSQAKQSSRSRDHSDECYVLDLCDLILGAKAFRQHKFDWLMGDP